MLADPSKEAIDDYLKKAEVFVATKEDVKLGVIVLLQLTARTAEIRERCGQT